MNIGHQQELAEEQIDGFRQARGPFVVAAEETRMPMLFTNAGDARHPIIFANDSMLKLTGYARGDLLGEPFAFLVAGTADPAASETLAEQFDDCQEGLNLEFRRSDGGRIWVAVNIGPVYDQGGQLVQHFISCVDLSAHMKRLRTERDALHLIYQHTPDFIAMTEGPDHRFTFANAAYNQLVGPRDLMGRTVAVAFPELANQPILEQLDTVYETGERLQAAGMLIKLQREPGADLDSRFLDFVCQPVRGADGQVTGMFWEGHDVTQQKESAEQVEALQSKLIHLSRVSAMGTMAATLGHELAQPLTAISNYAAACARMNRRNDGDGAMMADALAAIGECAVRGGEIIRRLRDATARRRSQREIFDLKDAVQESVVLVRAAAASDVAIEDRSRNIAKLEADRIQIQQVMMNLIRNACEAMAGTGGKVTITTALKGATVVVSVRDTGPGVSPEALKTLFNWAESGKPAGAGMGLSICRTIIEAHGGELWLDGTRKGGACFSFSLPIRSAAGDRAGVRPANDAVAASLQAVPSASRA